MLSILKTKKIIFLMFLICWFSEGIASAEPLVIRDYGGRDSGVPSMVEQEKKAQHEKYSTQPFDDAARYPIVSVLRPGYLDKSQALPNPVKGAKPFFIVGNDVFSRDWLEKNKAYLQKLGAQGLATNIDTQNTFKQLEVMARPLPLVAVPIDELVTVLHLSVYPVLVTGEEIAQ